MNKRPTNERNATSIEGFKVDIGESTTERPKKKKIKKKYKLLWGRAITICAICVGISFFLAIFAIDSAGDLLGLNQENQQIEIVVQEGDSFSDITSTLDENGVISTPLTFSLYAAVQGAGDNFNPGVYILNSNMSYDQIFTALSTEYAVKSTVQITFYEGMTIKEMASLLEENEVCDADEFIEVLDTGEFDYEFMQRIPEDEHRFRRLEGYVFPDTYEFFIGMDPTEVAKRFLSNFDARFTEEHYAMLSELGMSLDELITLASIIQEEASAVEQMGAVSSVLHNRLDAPATYPKLQCDVTIFYVESDIKPYMTEENQPLYDAYNTYVTNGLPVAPITNPGLAAIEAALMPSETNYYFFLTDVEGTYYYATTFEEHLANDRTASRIGETQGIATDN